MKIVFLEIQERDKEYIKTSFPSENIVFINKNIGELTDDEWKGIYDADILSVFIYSIIDKNTLDKFSNLKFITTRSTGFDHIDIFSAKNKGIGISNVPTYGENTVAEHTFALILSLSRHIPESIERTQKGKFNLDGLEGFDLKGKTIGIIGTGNIGYHVARIAFGFEMNIIATSRTEKEDLKSEFNLKYLPLNELLEQSDIITLHVPDLPETHHLINSSNIEKIKKGSILINTSRGGLIETAALVKALDSNILSGAGLDVLEEETLIKEEMQLLAKEFKPAEMLTALENHNLISRSNVIVTPHNAFNSKEALQRILDVTVENIKKYISSEPGNLIN